MEFVMGLIIYACGCLDVIVGAFICIELDPLPFAR